MTPTSSTGDGSAGLQIYGWLERPVLGLVAILVAVGFAHFGVVAALAFGAAADHTGQFDLAAVTVFIPAAMCAGLFALVPETRGLELEESTHT
jgi:hypothetical protein